MAGLPSVVAGRLSAAVVEVDGRVLSYGRLRDGTQATVEVDSHEMTDPTRKSITEALDAMRAEAPKRVDVNARLVVKPTKAKPPEADERALAILAACWEALMEVPSEREIAEQLGITFGQYLWHYKDSIIVPILVGQQRLIAGAMWFKDGQVHLAIKKKYRAGAWTRRLPELFEPGFRAFGDKLTAMVNKRNLVARRFTEKIGGRRIGENELAVEYELLKDRMKYWTRGASLAETKSDG